MKSNIKMKVNAIIQTIELATGKVLKETRTHNIVTNGGLDVAIDSGLSTFGYVAIGTDATGELVTDTELGAEVQRQAVTYTNEGVGIREYDHTFTFGSGESYTIIEYGIFNSATASGSIMLNRMTDAGHDVDVSNGVRVRITITLANS